MGELYHIADYFRKELVPFYFHYADSLRCEDHYTFWVQKISVSKPCSDVVIQCDSDVSGLVNEGLSGIVYNRFGSEAFCYHMMVQFFYKVFRRVFHPFDVPVHNGLGLIFCEISGHFYTKSTHLTLFLQVNNGFIAVIVPDPELLSFADALILS